MKWGTCALALETMLVSLGAASSDASAQTSASLEMDTQRLETVIVTAQKREQDLQDTAVAVTAITAGELERQGVESFKDVTKVAPEVEVQPGTFTNIGIRGVRTGAFGPTNESPTAVHLDGVYLPRFTGLSGYFFDIERLEVIAGPQGTLFGRNASAGVMNIITARPTQEFGGNGSIELGNYGLLSADAALNLPVSDTFALRGAARHYSLDGYFEETGLDDAEETAARLSAMWNPTERDSVLVIADLAQLGGNGAGSNIVGRLNSYGTVNPAVVIPTDARDNRALVGAADNARNDQENWGVMLQWDHEFAWATLTAQAAYRESDMDNSSGTLTGWTQPGFAPPRLGFVESHSRWNSQELRLASPSDRTIEWVLGAYRFAEDSRDNKNGSFSWAGDPLPGAQPLQLPINTRVYSNIGNEYQTTDAAALFGQATYTPAGFDRLHVTLGLRYNEEEKTAAGETVTAERLIWSFEDEGTWDELTYKANIAFDLGDESMVYADVSTGFKSGGFSYGGTPEYKPETITAYEVGTKNTFADGRLRLNFAAWYYDYEDYVNTVSEPILVGGQQFNLITVTNAGGARIVGQSVTLQMLLSEHDSVRLNGQHLDTEYRDFQLAFVPGRPPSNYSGTPVGRAPDWVANAGYNHQFVLPGGRFDLQLDVHYNGNRLLANQAVPRTPQYIESGDYATGDVSLRYDHEASAWAITLYARNVTDELYLTGGGYNALGYYTGSFGAPRTFGVLVSSEF